MKDSFNQLKYSTIIICGIVRNCGKKLENNILFLNAICNIAKEYHVIIYENDSFDKTKKILSDWSRTRKNIYISLNNTADNETIPRWDTVSGNPYFSFKRISKMASLRNKYMEVIDKLEITGDYLIVVDLDVIDIDLDGFLSSFNSKEDWDAVTAYGYLRMPFFKRIYYDAYALIECGLADKKQTLKTMEESRRRMSNLNRNQPWIKVFSAFGGLAIYKFRAIKDIRYEPFPNEDKYVEVKCEHYSIYYKMRLRGFDKVYINPNMLIEYKKITLFEIPKYLMARFHRSRKD
jgi:hypothetical protein